MTPNNTVCSSPTGSDRAAPALHWPSKSLWRTVNYPGCASYCSTCALLFWVLVLKTASHTAQGNGEGITVPPDDGTCHPRCHPVRWQLCKARARSLQKQVQHREALGRLQICLPSHPLGIVTMSLPNPHAEREIL